VISALATAARRPRALPQKPSRPSGYAGWGDHERGPAHAPLHRGFRDEEFEARLRGRLRPRRERPAVLRSQRLITTATSPVSASIACVSRERRPFPQLSTKQKHPFVTHLRQRYSGSVNYRIIAETFDRISSRPAAIQAFAQDSSIQILDHHAISVERRQRLCRSTARLK
jgi:hypothetical protein